MLDRYTFIEEIVLSELVWKKPVVCIFKERDVDPEVDPFVVVKARKITVSRVDNGEVEGTLVDFFTLMGDADYLSSEEGAADHYVMCWFDDSEADTTRDLRRLRGVALKGKVTCALNESGKRTYNAAFKAEHAKLK
jgi:hypothetical protein